MCVSVCVWCVYACFCVWACACMCVCVCVCVYMLCAVLVCSYSVMSKLFVVHCFWWWQSCFWWWQSWGSCAFHVCLRVQFRICMSACGQGRVNAADGTVAAPAFLLLQASRKQEQWISTCSYWSLFYICACISLCCVCVYVHLCWTWQCSSDIWKIFRT